MLHRIGEFAQLVGISSKTLRFYDEIGLLRPAFVDPITGYRYYGGDQVHAAHVILAKRALGLPLASISRALKQRSVKEKRLILLRLRADIAAQLVAGSRQLSLVDQEIEQLENDGANPLSIIVKHAPSLTVAGVRQRLSSYNDADELLKQVYSALPPRAREGTLRGAIWHACGGDAGFIECQAVIILGSNVRATTGVEVCQLPSNTFACAVHHGREETIESTYVALRAWIARNGYKVSGPNREIYHAARNTESGVLTEIQFPIAQAVS